MLPSPAVSDQYKLRTASCMLWNVACIILKRPSVLSRSINGSYELGSFCDYVAKLKSLIFFFFSLWFCMELLGFPAFPLKQCAQGKQNIWAGLCSADCQGWAIRNGVLLSHTNNSFWRVGDGKVPKQGSTFMRGTRGTAAIPTLPFCLLSTWTLIDMCCHYTSSFTHL